MLEPTFVDGVDKTTFAPFILIDCRQSQWPDVRISFDDWDWFREKHGKDTIDGYYMNGFGIQGLVLAARIDAGLEAYPAGMDPNSEGDTCYFICEHLFVAVETAQLASEMINERAKLEKMIQVARNNDLEE